MKKFLKRFWPLIGICLFLAIVAYYLTIARDKLSPEVIVKELLSVGEGLKLKDIQYTHEDPAREMKWVIDAKEVRFSEDKQTIFFDNFHLKLEPENKPFFDLKGKKGVYSRQTGELDLKGNLRGFTQNGYKVATEQVLINEKEGWLKGREKVNISGTFFSVKGTGIFVDLEKSKLKVLSDVTTIIQKKALIKQ
jgi:LPS export ABC transporter protein LptC